MSALSTHELLDVTLTDCMMADHADFQYRSSILDTGCNTALNQTDVNPFLTGTRDSDVSVRGFAGGNRVRGDKCGTAHVFVVSTSPGVPGSSISFETDTLVGLNHDLFSVTEFYENQKYDVHLRHDGFSGLCRRNDDGTETRIPVVYDAINHRWLLHYIIASSPEAAARAGKRLQHQLQRRTAANSALAAQAMLPDDADTLAAITQSTDSFVVVRSGEDERIVGDVHCKQCGGGDNALTAENEIETNETETGTLHKEIETEYEHDPAKDFNGTDAVLHGAKFGLPPRERKMTEYQLHVAKGHVGYCASCPYCKLAKKSLKRREKKVDPYHETRPGYKWTLDTITWSRKSRHGGDTLS